MFVYALVCVCVFSSLKRARCWISVYLLARVFVVLSKFFLSIMRWNFTFSDFNFTRIHASRAEIVLFLVLDILFTSSRAYPNFRNALFRSHSFASHHNGHRGHGPVGHFFFHRQLGVLRSQKESNTSKCLYYIALNQVISESKWISARQSRKSCRMLIYRKGRLCRVWVFYPLSPLSHCPKIRWNFPRFPINPNTRYVGSQIEILFFLICNAKNKLWCCFIVCADPKTTASCLLLRGRSR